MKKKPNRPIHRPVTAERSENADKELPSPSLEEWDEEVTDDHPANHDRDQ